MNEEIRQLARRLFWWKTPEEALNDTARFLAQLMTLGTWEDWLAGLRHWNEDAFRDALASAPPGVFDPPSWAYWHRRLGIAPIPPLPVRNLPDVP